MNGGTKKVVNFNLEDSEGIDMSVTENNSTSIDVNGVPYFSTPEGDAPVPSDLNQAVGEATYNEYGEIVRNGRAK